MIVDFSVYEKYDTHDRQISSASFCYEKLIKTAV